MKIEVIKVNIPSKPLSEDGQEYFDKLYGNPCTDMYDFEFLSEQECKELGVINGWKSKKKSNITPDQQIKRYRKEYSNKQNIEINENIEINDSLLKHLEKELKNDIDNEILRRLKCGQ